LIQSFILLSFFPESSKKTHKRSRRKQMKKRVIIEVKGGVAECTEAPDDIEVIIHDFDITDIGVEENENGKSKT